MWRIGASGLRVGSIGTYRYQIVWKFGAGGVWSGLWRAVNSGGLMTGTDRREAGGDFVPAMRALEFRGHRIVYVDEGLETDGRPALLFLHNGGTSHAIWLGVMARLVDRYRVVAIDLLGYGDSDHPGHGYTMEMYVSLVGHVVETLELARPVLVGNCMGSAISLNYALGNPEGARALVVINPLTQATLKAGALGGFVRFYRAAPGVAGPVYGAASKFRLPRWSAGTTLAMQLGKSGRAQGLQRHAGLVACHSSAGQLRSIVGVLEDMEAYAALDQFEKPEGFPPMMVVWGAQNQILSAKVGVQLSQKLRPEREETVLQGGHLAMLEEPGQVAQWIESFLQEQLLASAADKVSGGVGS